MAVTSEIGIVEPRDYHFGHDDDPFVLESGKNLAPVTIRYETYGHLNSDRSNAILVNHGFSGDAHAAGQYTSDDTYVGWWDHLIGPHKAIDTNRFYVISSNALGGCQGTTGPSSINEQTGKPYALTFPIITIRDIVRAQERLIAHLGIEKLACIIGASMGGMQALEWATALSEKVCAAIVIASTARQSTQGIAFNAVGRSAIMSDPDWNGGNYYDGPPPARGLALARMIGHITYLSDESLGLKFGRRLQERARFEFDFNDQFAVESYLNYKGGVFVDRFDANSYIYLTKAIDYFDIREGCGSLEEVFQNLKTRFLLLAYSSDWLYPPQQSQELASAMRRAGCDVSYVTLESHFGHDTFLLERERHHSVISSFLTGEA